MKGSKLYEGDGLRLTIFPCYSLEMTLNVDLDVSFGNIYGR
jgi:hypothetical protein